MVVICLPAASLTGKEQDRTATPSMWTVQAPHWAMPQPYLVPVRPIVSRIDPQQRGIGFDVDVVSFSVDGELDHSLLLHGDAAGHDPGRLRAIIACFDRL